MNVYNCKPSAFSVNPEVSQALEPSGVSRAAGARDPDRVAHAVPGRDASGVLVCPPPLYNVGAVSARIYAGLDKLKFTRFKGCAGSRSLAELPSEWQDKVGATGAEFHPGHGYHGVELGGDRGAGFLAWKDGSRETGDGGRVGGVWSWFELRGSGLAWMRERGCEPLEFLRSMLRDGWDCKECHAVMDTPEERISPSLVIKHALAGRSIEQAVRGDKSTRESAWVSSVETFDPRFGKFGKRVNREGGSGVSIYLGSMSSERYAIVYDKRADLIRLGAEDPGHLTRFELRLKGAAAGQSAAILAEKGYAAVPLLWAGFIQFKTLRGRSEARKRRMARWWRDLVGTVAIGLDLRKAPTSARRFIRYDDTLAAKRMLRIQYDPVGYVKSFERAKFPKAADFAAFEREFPVPRGVERWPDNESPLTERGEFTAEYLGYSKRWAAAAAEFVSQGDGNRWAGADPGRGRLISEFKFG